MTVKPELLVQSREWMPKLPFKDIDVLLIDQIGKNISGTGMDTNVIGRKPSEVVQGQPNVERIVLRGLTRETHGNATGVGFADFCLTRLVDEMDRDVTILNCPDCLRRQRGQDSCPLCHRRRGDWGGPLATLGLRPRSEAPPSLDSRTRGHLTGFVCSEAFSDQVAASPALDATGELRCIANREKR